MATPIIGTDFTDRVNAALINKAISSNGKLNIKLIYAKIRYFSGAWEVQASIDSSQILTGNLAWSTNKLIITISGYTLSPLPIVSQAIAATPYHLQASSTSLTTIDVQFFDLASTPITTEDTNMQFHIIIIGA